MKTPSMIKEMKRKGKKRIQKAEDKRRRKAYFQNLTEEEGRRHVQNRLDQESAIERSKKKKKKTGMLESRGM